MTFTSKYKMKTFILPLSMSNASHPLFFYFPSKKLHFNLEIGEGIISSEYEVSQWDRLSRDFSWEA